MLEDEKEMVLHTLTLVSECQYYLKKAESAQTLHERSNSYGQYLDERHSLTNYVELLDKLYPALSSLENDLTNNDFNGLSNSLTSVLKNDEHRRQFSKPKVVNAKQDKSIRHIAYGVSAIGAVALGVFGVIHLFRRK